MDKIRGYSRIKCTPHIRVQLNASPFHYGALNVSWVPLTSEVGNAFGYEATDSFSSAGLAAYSVVPRTGDYAMMRLSQRMNQYLYPQDNNTVDFDIPFIFPRDYIDLTAAPTRVTDVVQFGSLYWNTPVPLSVAQTLTGATCTINVYMWLTDVELSGPSYTVCSGLMSAAGEMLTALKDIPILGNHAGKAGDLMSASAKVVELLGFSNPPSSVPATAVANQVLPNLSSTEIDSTTNYLGLSKESGLSLDILKMGDELMIEDLAKSNTYLGVSTWQCADAVTTTLFQSNVTPELFINSLQLSGTSGSSIAIATIPACYISSMFKFWRGKVKFRFTAVMSQFHRGRLRIFYDSNAVVPTGVKKEGIVFSKMWDISEDRNLEFEIPFSSSTEMLSLLHSQFGALSTMNHACYPAPTSMVMYNPLAHNGHVRLEVANSLMGPNASSVYIICEASICNLELAVPCVPGEFHELGVERIVGLGFTNPYSVCSGSADVPIDHEEFDADVYVGEKVKSLRTLLHRSTFYAQLAGPSVTCAANTGAIFNNSMIIPREPQSPGDHCPFNAAATPSYQGDAIRRASNNHLALSGRSYNYVRMTPFNFLKPMFAGYRGSFRWKFVSQSRSFPMSNLAANLNFAIPLSIQVSRTYRRVNNFGWTAHVGSTGASYSNIAYKDLQNAESTLQGGSVNSIEVGGAIEVDMPHYSRFKFLPTNELVRSAQVEPDETVTQPLPVVNLYRMGVDGVADVTFDNMLINTEFFNQKSTSNAVAVFRPPPIRSYVSCGNDFSFVAFTNTPILYMVAPPAPLTT